MKIELINVDEGIHQTDQELQGPEGQVLARLQRLHGGLSDGVDVLHLSNGRLDLKLLPTRGMGVWKGTVDGTPLQWNSPVQRPVNPAYVDPMRLGGIGWVDGFNELIVRCGLGWHGAPGNDTRRNEAGEVISEQFLPLHGRIANLPAHYLAVQLDGDTLIVEGIVDEGCLFGGWLRLHSKLQTTLGSAEFEITDTVTNLAATPAESEILYHCNIGEPFLEAGSTLHTAVSQVIPRNDRAMEGLADWSRYQGPQAGFAEQVYFMDPLSTESGWATAALADSKASRAFAVHFATATLPCLTLWKNTGATADGYVTGIEPGSTLPNPRQFEREQGRLKTMQPGEQVTYQLRFEIAPDVQSTAALLSRIEETQSAESCNVHHGPHADWCS
jgi:hypothetical protein